MILLIFWAGGEPVLPLSLAKVTSSSSQAVREEEREQPKEVGPATEVKHEAEVASSRAEDGSGLSSSPHLPVGEPAAAMTREEGEAVVGGEVGPGSGKGEEGVASEALAEGERVQGSGLTSTTEAASCDGNGTAVDNGMAVDAGAVGNGNGTAVSDGNGTAVSDGSGLTIGTGAVSDGNKTVGLAMDTGAVSDGTEGAGGGNGGGLCKQEGDGSGMIVDTEAVSDGNGTVVADGNGIVVADGNGIAMDTGAVDDGNGTAVSDGNGTAAGDGNGTAVSDGNGTAAGDGNGTAASDGNGTAVSDGNGTAAVMELKEAILAPVMGMVVGCVGKWKAI